MAPPSVKQLAQRQLWRSISSALGTELRDRQEIPGASGIIHSVEAISVDDKTKRIIVISAEPNPRIAALIQSDIQSTMPDVRVLVARPSIIDLGVLVRDLFKTEFAADFTVEQAKRGFERVKRWADRMKRMSEEQKKAHGTFIGEKIKSGTIFKGFAGAAAAMNVVTFPALAQIVGAIEQASAFDWQSVVRALHDGSDDTVIPMSALYRLDNAAIDRAYGICPIPLYELGTADWDSFLAARDIELIRERLKGLGIYQYFFPPADQVALGAVERGLARRSDVIELVNSSPNAGHPLAPSELVPTGTQITEIVDALADRGFVTEIEQSVEVSPSGMQARTAIKTRPREGLISKLMTRFKFKADVQVRVDSRDILGPH